MKSAFTFICSLWILFTTQGLFSQRLQVSSNGRYLVTQENEPFFWLADTAWELFHRCDEKQAALYLSKRAEQGFNVIQAVALAELDGLNEPNPYGETPLNNNDPTSPNEAYFRHVDRIIQMADSLGLYMALLPTWGDKVNTKKWGVGPEIFNPKNAYTFGEWIGNRYKDFENIIWVIGGDRNPRDKSDDVLIWNQMAEGIVKGAGGYDSTLMTYHPQPTQNGGSSSWFHDQKWLDFNMHQTGHCANKGTYKHIQHDYALVPIKPVLDGEPLYEDHPNCFNAKELGYSTAEDIRRIMYWNVFAGALGQSYGCHAVWQMYAPDKEPINGPLRPWTAALEMPMANQVKHLKNLMLSRPFLTRIPDQDIIHGEQAENNDYKIATRDQNGSYAMVYMPTGGKVDLDVTALASNKLTAWWYDPRTGSSFLGGEVLKSDYVTIHAPTSGKGHDWVLVLDATQTEFSAPGKVGYSQP